MPNKEGVFEEVGVEDLEPICNVNLRASAEVGVFLGKCFGGILRL
jgi:hypothetical protein